MLGPTILKQGKSYKCLDVDYITKYFSINRTAKKLEWAASDGNTLQSIYITQKNK